MSYSIASRGNVTMIDDLPELSEIESGHGSHSRQPMPSPQIPDGVLSPEMAQKIQRHVRHRYVPTQEAGMSSYGNPQMPPPPVEQQENYAPQQFNPLTSISCMDFHGHVQGCPICSRFYNSDKTVLYVVIVVLTIVCLLLLKKVLDV